MLIVGQERSSQIAVCLGAADNFHLETDQAIAIVLRQLETIGAKWTLLCDEADLGQVDRAVFWGRQFLNPFAFYGLTGEAALLAERAAEIRAAL